MRKFISFLLIISGIVALISCQGGQSSLQKKIAKLEASVRHDTVVFDKVTAIELRDTYLEYLGKYPDDTICGMYTFKAGEISMNLRDSKKAIELFESYSKKWPEKPKSGDCMFLIGFIYENDLKNYNQASKAYSSFIKKYPDHPFADDAQILIDNLGKSPEELIKEFEAKNAKTE